MESHKDAALIILMAYSLAATMAAISVSAGARSAVRSADALRVMMSEYRERYWLWRARYYELKDRVRKAVNSMDETEEAETSD